MTTKRKSRMKPFDAIPYSNGDYTLNPGDDAIAVTTCAGSGNLRAGKYLGVRDGNVVMEVHDSHKRLVHKETEEPYDYRAERIAIPYPAAKYDRTLRWGTPEYKAQDAENQRIRDEYTAKIAERQSDYFWKHFPYTWITNLQNNNIYPGAIALRDVKL